MNKIDYIRKNIKNFDRFSFYKRAVKAIDEKKWDDARVNLEFLLAYINICQERESGE